jgi:hypothetical protein
MAQKSHGIILSTGTTAERASGKIIDNYVRGHGLKNSSQSVYNPECGILIYYTSGVLVDGNTVVIAHPWALQQDTKTSLFRLPTTL